MAKYDVESRIKKRKEKVITEFTSTDTFEFSLFPLDFLADFEDCKQEKGYYCKMNVNNSISVNHS